MPPLFFLGEKVVYHDKRQGVPLRGVVVRTLLASCVVHFPRLSRELLVPMSSLRRCPVRLAYTRPCAACTPRSGA